ncbi:sugar transferase, partial [Patescibacteria group bacterium]|nr:sugar transferase [Patescibacteria group bacterium]
ELPQFFNALIGNMSIVGPRPHQEREVANYKKEHLRVLDVKPGITGLAQVSGRSDLSYEEELRLDLYYVDNWSFLTDLRIALKTPFAAIGRRKAE